MRIRDKTLKDYYMDRKDYDETLEQIGKSDARVRIHLLELCIRNCAGFEVAMYDSISFRLSYEKVLNRREVFINRNDFYAYRRKIIAEMFDYFRLEL